MSQTRERMKGENGLAPGGYGPGRCVPVSAARFVTGPVPAMCFPSVNATGIAGRTVNGLCQGPNWAYHSGLPNAPTGVKAVRSVRRLNCGAMNVRSLGEQATFR